MKKFLILVTVAVVAISVVAGCGGIKTYTDFEEVIDLRINQEFVIAFESNATTGYAWEASYDETMVELVEQTYELSPEAEQGLVGAGGKDVFRFKALKKGETKITMVYKRPWEDPTPQDITEEFNFSIR